MAHGRGGRARAAAAGAAAGRGGSRPDALNAAAMAAGRSPGSRRSAVGVWVCASPWIWGYDDVDGAIAADADHGRSDRGRGACRRGLSRPAGPQRPRGPLADRAVAVGFGTDGPGGLSDRSRARRRRLAHAARAHEALRRQRPSEACAERSPRLRTQGPCRPAGPRRPPTMPAARRSLHRSRAWRRTPLRPLGRGVDGRPAGVARPDPPAQRRHAPPHRPVAVRVLADHGARVAEPAGLRPVGAVLRVPEDRDRRADGAPRALVEGRALRGPARAARRRRCGGRRRPPVASMPVAAVQLHRRVVLARPRRVRS